MPLTTKSAWALMDGATPQEERRMHVKALSKFWSGGKLIGPPTVIEVPELLAAELVQAHKAEIVSGPITLQEVFDGESVHDTSESSQDVQGVD
jgi:hypothetical protein